MWCLAL